MRATRILCLLPAMVVSILLLEILSLGAGTLLYGVGYFPRARQDRTRIANDEAEAAGGVELPSSLRSYVLHPYLGFVADDDTTTGPTAHSQGQLVRTDLGFFRRTDTVVPTTADPIRIGIFGGSVAFMFGMVAEQVLARAVAASPEAASREVVVENFALPGHKQPQQLFTLLYLLLLGRRFDVVVNLDGFNELVLPVTENLAHGTAAIYPRSWSLLAADAAGASLRKAAVTRSDDVALRRVLARAFSVRIVRQSFTATLLWQVFDDAL